VVEALRDALLERDELVGSEITTVIEAAVQDVPDVEVVPALHRQVAAMGRA
jgi:hypothetical protein